MSAITKFPTKSRIMVFPKRARGRWVCDGRLAFFCKETAMNNTEIALEASVYEKSKSDLIKAWETLPEFEKISERARFIASPGARTTFDSGFVIVRFDARWPEETRGDNYVITFSTTTEGEQAVAHLYLPEKIWDFIESNTCAEMNIYVGSDLKTIIFTDEDFTGDDLTGIRLESTGRQVIAIYSASQPIYDASNNIL